MTKLADAYFRWYHGNKADEWARDLIDEIFCEDADEAWIKTLELIDAAPSKESLYYVAAGQLETLVSNCGLEMIERIKQEARRNKKLLFAMTGVYIDDKNAVCNEYVSFVRDELNIRTESDVNALVDLPEKLLKK